MLWALENILAIAHKDYTHVSNPLPPVEPPGLFRYDQSVINLLLANAYDYDTRNYVSSIGDGATIMRVSESGFTETDFACE
ncbi:hypothetical protein Y032_0193g1393 [Ancylostoma ceylanicum]|uniref:Uncharacterized protein n=1 Tax=Ancylostoma ceylanicum TaxID=53326 RepID=A0A016SQ58_9BILA|nr:hypothetical protein Y032_0193g1393 [Ancylostoma ceylanicum]